ncbi:SDR family oxidoreductase [Corynebacterium sp. 153RC1]|uniref:SDR family oxidoreductase n=1 Tax=unclassified Corynebacterium TaxID=2624378 RepID=UPI00211C9A57|nr:MULTISPECIES: SDR family oxidoreductase [unclassified Corynebacterium]MCQ9371415.1 SDR family oxidoreductase [Corynebacterium sp. 35RC1]MCQ9353347.1 SDR family oxidoreductase [Corynebacterium sp. 209RC1]MCQ9355602.1 SDR family oxidoreductase [Corynebacterium sp. 1222RC1]MCQ9357786.1 SDR family oxidoreductase [Corynebacterium sp. 122RC1]MCQ9359991.1 SDR family oxidoreductase [Corynebacterium sp. 142RC1]
MEEPRIAVVTGASGGVGLATTQLLAAVGYTVYAQYRTEPAEVPLGEVNWWQADLTEENFAYPSDLGHVDVLVHCAGMCELGATADIDPQAWRDHFELNVVAPATLTNALLPALRAAQGMVIYVNSGAGQRTHAGWGAYSASKFAARAWADALRQEEKDLRVSSIYPGRIATAMQEEIRKQEGGEYDPSQYLRAETVASHILGIISTASDAVVEDLSIRPNA